MSPDDKLTTAQVAALVGVQPGTWRAQVSRGQRPLADGYAEPCGCPWWYLRTITAFFAARAERATLRSA